MEDSTCYPARPETSSEFRTSNFSLLEKSKQWLNTRYHAPWKINPHQVADFYTLSQLVYRPADHYLSDEEQIMISRAHNRIYDIGKSFCVALLHEQCLEFQHHGASLSFPQSHLDQLYNVIENLGPNDSPDQILLDKQSVFDTLSFFEKRQNYKNWRQMATYIKAFLFPHNQFPPIIPPQIDDRSREVIIVDAMINFSHVAGHILPRMSNNLFEMALVSLKSGLGGNTLGLLFPHCSVGLKAELLGRSRSLLPASPQPFLPIDKELTDEEKDALFKAATDKNDGTIKTWYLYGLFLMINDFQFRKRLVEYLVESRHPLPATDDAVVNRFHLLSLRFNEYYT